VLSSYQTLLVGKHPITARLSYCSFNGIRNRLVNQERHAEALAVISALEDKPHNHPDVQRTFSAIREAALAENTLSEKGKSHHKFNLRELLHGGRSQNFRRATLGIVIQAFQQITGINLIT
jgi:hypothetical protein